MFSAAGANGLRRAPVAALLRSGTSQAWRAAGCDTQSASQSSHQARRPARGDATARFRKDSRGSGEGRGGRRDREGREATTRARPGRFQENDKTPRFQQFGRPGGEGRKVADVLYEEFGMNGLPKYSPAPVDEPKVLKWLEAEIKIRSRAVADMVEKEPRIVEQSCEAIAERLAWFKERLQLSEEQMRSLVYRKPSLLCRDVKSSMEVKVRWLQNSLELGNDEVASMVTSAPNILSSSVEGSLEPKLGWLAKRLNLSREEVMMVLTTCPQVMTSSIDGALEPRLQWLQEKLQIGRGALRERVLTFPWLLTLSEETKLAPTFDFLKSELLLDEADIRKTLFRNPRMFLTPLRLTLASTKKCLCRSLGVKEDEALAIVGRDARLLLRSTEVLESKVEFFRQEMGATLQDLREVLLSSPNILLVSLEMVLAPRVTALRRAGVSPSFNLHWNTLAFGPRGDEFDQWVDRQARRSRN